MDVQKTINYFQFKKIKSNRPVDQRHVTDLAAKIKEKNLLHLFPILVNSAMEVVDGQHRLAAAELAGEYIYYIVDDQLTKGDIASVNTLAKNWSILDYINYWHVENAPGFDKLVAFMLENPLLPPSTVVLLFNKGWRMSLAPLKQGQLDVSNYDQAVAIAEIIKEYAEFISFAYERNFIIAVVQCVKTPGYSHAIMRTKLEFQSRRVVKCVTVKEYMGMFDEIYNYGSSKNRLKIAA